MKPVKAGNYDGVPFPVVAFLAKADIVSNVDQILLETPQCIIPVTRVSDVLNGGRLYLIIN